MTDAALDITGLTKRFGDTVALDGVGFRLESGQLLALLGPNGAGKTTTIEICQGNLRPTGGSVQVLGQPPTSTALRPRVGVMPQGGGAYPGIRAAEMLNLVAACARQPLDVDWLLDVLGLDAARKTPFKRLSGGQQQRLSLACAIVGRPELVFLDEPTAGMDPQARHLVWELLQALRADGVSVVLTTHMMEEAETLADHVVIIDHGKLVVEGSPAELTGKDDGSTRLHFDARPGLDLALLTDVLPEGHEVQEIAPGSYRVDGHIDPQVISAVTAWCAQNGVFAERLHAGGRDLEDVFLDLTGRELRS